MTTNTAASQNLEKNSTILETAFTAYEQLLKGSKDEKNAKILFQFEESGLSPNVNEMVTLEGHSATNEEVLVPSSTEPELLVLNWKLLTLQNLLCGDEELIAITAGHEREVEKFKAGSKKLKGIIMTVYQKVKHWKKADFEKYRRRFELLPEDIFDQLLAFVEEQKYYLSFASGVTFLERSIGDLLIYARLIQKQKAAASTSNTGGAQATEAVASIPTAEGKQGESELNPKEGTPNEAASTTSTSMPPTPSSSKPGEGKGEEDRIEGSAFTEFRELKLSDMLTSKSLIDELGEDIIFFLRLFTGPIQGMNVRNLVWHGFFGLNDLHVAYTYFLLVLILSLPEIPFVHDYLNASIQGRYKRRSLHAIDEMFHKHAATSLDYIKNSYFYDKKFNDLFAFTTTGSSAEMTQHLYHVFERSVLIPKNRLSQWKAAWQEFLDGNYYNMIVIMFPLLEFTMRRLFVHANQCHQRLLSAERTVLHTTFDEILSATEENEMSVEAKKKAKKKESNAPKAGKRNKIFDLIGEEVALAMYDLMIWPSGPRIRDKLSHGCCSPLSIPRILAERTLAICFFLVFKYDLPEVSTILSKPEPLPESSPEFLAFKRNIMDYMDNYRPFAHPQALLAADLIQAYQVFVNEFLPANFPEPTLHEKEAKSMDNYEMMKLAELEEYLKEFSPQFAQFTSDYIDSAVQTVPSFFLHLPPASSLHISQNVPRSPASAPTTPILAESSENGTTIGSTPASAPASPSSSAGSTVSFFQVMQELRPSQFLTATIGEGLYVTPISKYTSMRKGAQEITQFMRDFISRMNSLIPYGQSLSNHWQAKRNRITYAKYRVNLPVFKEWIRVIGMNIEYCLLNTKDFEMKRRANCLHVTTSLCRALDTNNWKKPPQLMQILMETEKKK